MFKIEKVQTSEQNFFNFLIVGKIRSPPKSFITSTTGQKFSLYVYPFSFLSFYIHSQFKSFISLLSLFLLLCLSLCDQIGLFLKGILAYFLTKVAQISVEFGWYLKNVTIFVKLQCAFWATFVKNWATLNSIIWSHWSLLFLRSMKPSFFVQKNSYQFLWSNASMKFPLQILHRPRSCSAKLKFESFIYIYFYFFCI